MTGDGGGPIGLGVIGAGVAAVTGHLPASHGSHQFHLLAVLDVERGRLEQVGRLFGAPRLCTNIEDFLQTPGLQAVIIATPPDSHVELSRRAIERGLHVLVEKPMARTADECRELQIAAKDAGVVLAVGHEKRFHPTMVRLARLLAEGQIGQPYFCGVHWASNAKLDPINLIPAGYERGYRWRWEDPNVGGGIIQDHLPHYVDLIAHLSGRQPVAVYAQAKNVARDHLKWPVERSLWDDFGLCLVRYEGGLLLRLETGVVGRSLSPIWSLGSGVGEWTEYGYILATGGQVVFDLLPWDASENGRLAVWRLEAAVKSQIGWSFVEQPEPDRRAGPPSGAAAAMFQGQLAAFAHAIEGRSSDIARGSDGALAVALVEAAYESSATGREVQIPASMGVHE